MTRPVVEVPAAQDGGHQLSGRSGTLGAGQGQPGNQVTWSCG